MAFALPLAASAMAAAAPAVAATAAKVSIMAVAKSVLMNVAISAAMSALQPQVGTAGKTFEWTLDPNAPIPFAAGRVGVAGTVAHLETYGPDKMYYGFVSVLSGAGPIKSLAGFRADDEFVAFDGNGKAVSSQWAGEMWLRSRLGTQPDTALSNPPGLKNNAQLPGWSAAHKLSGKACYMLVLGENSKRTAYPTGEPKPLATIEGLFGWDPRQDGTYPGGVGACRLNNPATWVWLDNPILWALKWSLGLWEGPIGKGAPGVDYQVGGIGATVEGIDVPAFVAAANVADANGWKVAAYPTTDDDKAQVLDGFLQAGGAIYSQRAGKISCIQRAAPRASIVSISAADTAGPIEIDTAASRIDRINTIRPRFWSEAHRWQMTAIDEVSADAYRTEDGAVRPRGIDYAFVPLANQAAQLAGLQIANTREGIAGTIPLKPHLRNIVPGTAFTITEPGFLLDGLKCLCLNSEYDPLTGIVSVTFVSETDAKYPFALGQSTIPPVAPALTPPTTFVSQPLPDDWNIQVRNPVAGVSQVPEFEVSGEVSNATATAVLLEWGPAVDGPWRQVYLGPPTTEKIPVTGMQPETQYFIAISYIRNQNQSERQVYGPYIAPPLVASDTVNVDGVPAGDVAGAASQVPGLAGLMQDAQEAIATHQATLYTATSGLVDRTDAILATLNTPTTGVVARVTAIDTQINTPTSGMAARLQAVDAAVNTPTTGLIAVNATQQTALADLALNKAEASTVAIVQARLNSGENMLVNPSGRDLQRGWLTSGPAWTTYQHPSWGWWFTAVAAPGETRTNHYIYQTVVAQPGQYTLSGWAYSALAVPGSFFMYVSAIDAGGNELQFWQRALNSHGYFDPLTITAPANTASVRVHAYMYGVQGFSQVGVARLKLEAGPYATPFSDDASMTAIEARATVAEANIATITATKADASRVAQVEAKVSGAGFINENADLSIWPIPTALPTGWFAYNSGPTRVPGFGPASYAARFVTDGSSFGARIQPYGLTQGWQVVTTEITLNSGSYAGIGILFRPINQAGVELGYPFEGYVASLPEDDDPGGAAIGAGVAGRTYRQSHLIDCSGAAYATTHGANIYLMIDGFFNAIPKDVTVRVLGVRRATATEVELRKARGVHSTLTARYAALEQSTADLATGKASVLRVEELEARAGGANLIPKAQWFEDDLAPWTLNGGDFTGAFGIWDTISQWAPVGERSVFMYQSGAGTYYDILSPAFPVAESKRYCFSAYLGEHNYNNRIYARWENAAGAVLGYSGGPFSEASPSKIGGNSLDDFKRAYLFDYPPAGTKMARLMWRREGAGGAGYSFMVRPMASEAGATQTVPPPWSGAALEASVSETKFALSSLEGRVEGRALLQVVAGNQIAGMQALAVSGPDASYSVINFWAGSFQVSNNGAAAIAPFEVRDNVVRMREAVVDRLSVGASIVVGTRRLRVAVQPFPVSCTDGVPVLYGYDIGGADIVFLRDGPVSQPGTGESNNFYAESPTGTGFTPRLKIITAGAPTNQAQGPAGFTNDGVRTYYTLVAAAANNTVNVRVTGVVQSVFTNPNYNPGLPLADDGTTSSDGYMILRIWGYAGGWVPLDEIFVGPNYRGINDAPGTYYDGFDLTQAQAVNPSITHVGVSVEYEAYAGSYLTDVRLAYQTASTSGTRSATPNGEMTTAMIYPKNGA